MNDDATQGRPPEERSGTVGDGAEISRVALVVVSMPPGGKERVLMHLGRELRSGGVEPTIICLSAKGGFGRLCEAEGIRVESLDSRRSWDFGAVRRLGRLLAAADPDVINVHDLASLPYAFCANRISGRRPVVLSCHGLLLPDASRRFRLQRIAARDVRRMTAVSNPTGMEYARLLNWSGDVHVIPNGVFVPAARPDAGARVRSMYSVPDDVFVFLAAGGVKPEKGYDNLLGAASILRRRDPGRRFCVLIAGAPQDDAHYRTLCDMRQRLGLGDVVRFLGCVEDMDALYPAADAFVMSSRKEGLPMVLLESMAAGLAVVAARVGGVPDVVADDRTGLLVSPDCPEALAEGMSKLLGSPQLRERLGRGARANIEADFSVSKMASRYLEVYRLAIAK